MLARLSGTEHAPLAALTSREPDDPSLALLDAWAVVADILTFYQERIANEGYLRTATEQESLVRLGRLVGHRPRPALAAGAFLAYTLDPGTRTLIPAGSQVKSTPSPGGMPQTFETSEDLSARAEWNQLPVCLHGPASITSDAAGHVPSVDLEGMQPSLGAGSCLLFTFGDPVLNVVRIVESVVPDPHHGRTTVFLKVPQPTEQLDQAVQVLRDDVDRASRKTPSDTPFEDLLHVLREVLHSADVLRDPDLLAAALDDKVRRFRERISEGETDPAHAADILGHVTARVTAVQDAARRVADEAEPEPGTGSPFGSEPVTDRRGSGRQPLQALGPLLHVINRPPSRPPRNPSDAAASVADLFSAESDSVSRLLAANSPRHGASFYQALGTFSVSAGASPGVQCLRVKAAPFGATIPDDRRVAALLREVGSARRARRAGGASETDVLLLDAVYDTILPGSWIAVQQSDEAGPRIIQVTGVTQLAVADESYAVRVTSLRLAGPWTDDPHDIPRRRATTVWAAGQALALAAPPDASEVTGDKIQLAGTYEGLIPGRWLIVSGERTDIPNVSGVLGTELVMLAGVRQEFDGGPFDDRVRSTLLLTTGLAYRYRRDTLVIHGNVVFATAGETHREILGNGDATRGGQVFSLRQGPLAWLPARTHDGVRETFTVQVDDSIWSPTDDLSETGPNARAYQMRVRDDGGAAVEFGDGRHGARLSTGVENVSVTYRVGGGSAGNVRSDQINQVVSRPFGVKSVTNPLPATGGTDADGLAGTRRGVPLRLSALDRLVSVRDYQDFALAFAGVGKAVARRCREGSRQLVHVTIDAAGETPLESASPLVAALQAALGRYGDPALPVRVEVCERVRLVLSIGVRTLTDHARDKVERAVQQALSARLGFAASEIARPVFLSVAIAAAQAVPGVDYVDVDAFGGVPNDTDAAGIVRIAQQLGPSPFVAVLPAGYRETGPISNTDMTTGAVAVNASTGGRSSKPGPTTAVRGALRPAQLAFLDAALPETLILRRMS
ncbi:putative baseplate assembly protein [Streptomyces sp. NPDC002265]|uniref:putative baseplate assembly protein n=1 Tax=Streptomyces sp. NPDC002265 TaxID=3154415 RepID=UPI003332519D